MKRGVVVGFDYYAKFLADLVNEHSADWRLSSYTNSRIGTMRAIAALRKADALISFGGPAPNSALTEAARRRNIPIFVIWAGSDVIKAWEDPIELEVTKQEEFIHLSDGPWLVDELRDLGVHAEYLPVTAIEAGGPLAPFGPQFRVLTYLPEPRREFYGARMVYDIARAMPDIPFTVVGAGGRSLAAPENVQFCGLVSDMERRIDESTVLLRHPEHDGKSMLVLETLARARHVVWNYEFPFVHTARGFDEVLAALQDLRSAHERGALQLNVTGRDFALDNFSRERVAERFTERLSAGLCERVRRKRGSTHRVAISGLSLFCADIAQRTRRMAPEWEPRLLRTNSRLDVLTSLSTIAACDVWYSIGSPITDRYIHMASQILRKPHVVHWVGSDIAWLAENREVQEALRAPNVLHLAEVEWTAAQLRELGFQARIAPLPPRHDIRGIRPLPERFTVMLYVPRMRPDFYGRESFVMLMERLKGRDIRYLVVGGGEIDAPPGVDVENLGWRDNLHPVYEQSTVLVRNTPRDGLSLMVLEALSYGRHVLWTQDFPFTRPIHTYVDIEREMLDLYELHVAGRLTPQAGANELVATKYAPTRCTRAIAQAWADAMEMGIKPELAMEASR